MSRYEHLIGRQFDFGTTDCFSLIRDFYEDNYGITLPNYARPTDFWEKGLNLYRERYHKNGFRPLDVHPSEYQPGDIFLMQIQSTVANHAAVLVENGRILHHIWGRLSTVEPYKGIWRNSTVGVFRHKDVTIDQSTVTKDLMDYLPPNIRRKINAAVEAHQGTAQETPR